MRRYSWIEIATGMVMKKGQMSNMIGNMPRNYVGQTVHSFFDKTFHQTKKKSFQYIDWDKVIIGITSMVAMEFILRHLFLGELLKSDLF